MHPVIIVRFMFYATAILFHLLLAFVVGILEKRGLLRNFDGNRVPIIIGSIGAVVLTAFIVCDLTRSHKAGTQNRDRRWISCVGSEVKLFVLLMVFDQVFCARNTYVNLSGTRPCPHGPLILGLWWAATGTVTIYVWGLVVVWFTVFADLDSEANVRDYFDFSETRHLNKAVGDLEWHPRGTSRQVVKDY